MSDFSLIETMRWEPGTGIVRLRLHLARLKRSAGRLGFPGADKAAEKLSEVLGESVPLRVRLTLSPAGEIAITTAPFSPLPEETIWRVAVATARLDSTDKLLRHKTTRRDIYEAARAEYPAAEADEVLLLNERGAPCEGTITSIFLDDGSAILKTPPIACGLLAGVLRTEMICARRARVQRLTLADLQTGTLYMGNSLRGMIRAQLLPGN
ncbi:aminotransferase class IV family protein [Pararhizobium sp. YC-54]|uniref:aminotransferase class IV family protein n=1 Tax=Pararhizobium sp. YC-54 TaxID=2986920 RepID=UPI0021F6F84C|nr:aminotransferase class IV family protein [Pararhizobium sp. YC-54]MCV9998453.1 aminotransferase class IV family protein [Pararhizobium sp. YC-54]